MAQFRKDTQQFIADNKTLFETTMLAKNDGGVIAEANPLPITDFGLQVARGVVTGVTGLSISGYNSAVGATWVPVWEVNTAYTYFPTAQKVLVWSDSASDVNVTITINGLDANYVMQSETVVLNNGTTGVQTTKNFYRINSLSTIGSVNAVGTIKAGSTDKTITLAAIIDGAGRSQMTIYTVPAGYTFYLTQVNVQTNQNGSKIANYRSFTQSPLGLTTKVLQFPMTTGYNSVKISPRPYAEKTDIQWQCSAAVTSQIGAQIEGYLIAN